VKFKKSIWRVFAGSLVLVPVFLIACQGLQKTVTPENRIPLLDGGPHSGNWESRTILLDYEYQKHAGEIKLSLQVKIKTHARYDGYSVWVIFADEQGEILEERSIWSWENTLKIPPQTVYLSFRTHIQPHVYRPKIYR
jgi:hypothetical protein